MTEIKPCPFCGKAVEDRPNPGYAALVHHPPYDRRCPLSDKFYVADAWNTRPAPEDDEEFCAKVWEALKGDHTDLRKQAIILEAHRATLLQVTEARTPDVASLLNGLREAREALASLASGSIDVSGTALIYNGDPRELVIGARDTLAHLDTLLAQEGQG